MKGRWIGDGGNAVLGSKMLSTTISIAPKKIRKQNPYHRYYTQVLSLLSKSMA
jgi:hypothetical protein